MIDSLVAAFASLELDPINSCVYGCSEYSLRWIHAVSELVRSTLDKEGR